MLVIKYVYVHHKVLTFVSVRNQYISYEIELYKGQMLLLCVVNEYMVGD